MGDLMIALQSILEFQPDWTMPAMASAGSESPQFDPPELGGAKFLTVRASCHTIGDGMRFAPDLAAVTLRRDPDWLQRFLLGPDAMLAAG